MTPPNLSDYFRELGRKGGKSRSKKKLEAGRKNIIKAHEELKKNRAEKQNVRPGN